MKSAAAIQLTDLEPRPADFRGEMLAGLRQQPRRLPCKFFYDHAGSQLFDRICETPEYYPTRTEMAILAEHRREIVTFCGPRCRLVELGSGSSLKTRQVLATLDQPLSYVPIDISRQHLWQAAVRLAEAFPGLEVLPVCADYAQDIVLPDGAQEPDRTVVFFPGSTIGNFEPVEAIAFLQRLAAWCRPGDRLILGADLEKPIEVVEAAYNDAAGVTAAFNLNLLERANRELEADFNPAGWAHSAVYDTTWSRIEMRLISRARQSVRLAGETFPFAADEAIVTEYSHKFTVRRLRQLAIAAGWLPLQLWTDERGWFAVIGCERT